MKSNVYIIALLAVLVLFITACTDGTTTGSGSDVYDQKPKVCSSSTQSYYVSRARTEYNTDLRTYETARTTWLREHNNSIEGFTEVAPGDFVEPTGIDVTTHVLIYEGPGTSKLYRNQSFNIVLHPIDVGSDVTVTTVDAKASTTIRHDFSSLNELEVRITPVVNASEFIPKTVTYRLFVPCQDTWFINIPYTIQKNTTGTAEDLDVPALIIQGDLGGINEENPQPTAPNDTMVLTTKIAAGGPKRVLVFEYNADEILKIQLKKDGEYISRTDKPSNETVMNVANREIAYGPIAQSGDYDIIVYVKDVQPSHTIQAKLFNGDTLEKAGDVYFTNKSFRVDLQDDNTRTVIVIILVLFVLIVYGDQIFNGGKKR